MSKIAERLRKKLMSIAKDMGEGSVSVGFLEGSTYPDGTPVAAVAFWNEFGTERGIPPRPFFRNMISKESPGWPKRIAAVAKATNYDGKKVLGMMGEDIKGALVESIIDLTDPPLSEKTIKRKGFDKPLVDTSHMKNSVDYEVEK